MLTHAVPGHVTTSTNVIPSQTSASLVPQAQVPLTQADTGSTAGNQTNTFNAAACTVVGTEVVSVAASVVCATVVCVTVVGAVV